MAQKQRRFEESISMQCGLNYLLHLPADYTEQESRDWPLILFLHGAGERGDDVNSLKREGIAKIVESRPNFPFITVSPQCPRETWWSDHIPPLIGLMDQIEGEYRVNPRRIYLTGLSMGSYGGWHMLTELPERFAAAILICGGRPWYLDLESRSRRIADVPLWIFHGDADDIVDISQSQEVVDALKTEGSTVRYTIYPGVGHDAWTRTYENPEIYDWLMQHTIPT